MDDQIEFTHLLDSADTPKFIFCQSLGALIASQTVIEHPQLFNGVTFVTPFFNLSQKDQQMFEKL